MNRPALNPRRILYVEGNLDGTIGGSFYSLLFLVKGLDKSRFAPTVMFSIPNALIPKYEAAGARVLVRPNARPVQWSGAFGRLFSRIANFMLAFVIEPWSMARLCRREQFDLVHLNNSVTGNLPWMLGAWWANTPCITHERGINPRVSSRVRFCSRFLTRVICISEAVRSTVENLKLRGPTLVTIPNGLDPAEMRVTRPAADIHAELGIAPDRPVIGIIGNIKPWKGQEVVIRAVAMLKRTVPDVVCLLIGDFGRDDQAYRPRIAQLIAEQDVRDNVIVTGYRANVADYVNALRVVIHASVDPEPFGRVLLEAMALSKAVVASRGGAAPEIVVEGATGLLFTPGDAADLARQLERLIGNAAERDRMGRAGFDRLGEQFGIERNVRRTQDLYQQILG
jgi:glycosyltransferase involved in cell wall biosynthesis